MKKEVKHGLIAVMRALIHNSPSLQANYPITTVKQHLTVETNSYSPGFEFASFEEDSKASPSEKPTKYYRHFLPMMFYKHTLARYFLRSLST